jgi:hypothetical protein
MACRGQHRFSTGSGNDGKQPALTGQSGYKNGPPNWASDSPFLNQKNPRNRRSVTVYQPLSSWRAITMRWTWLVPS